MYTVIRQITTRTFRQQKSDEGEDAADDHGEETHPASAPPVEEQREDDSGGQLSDRGQRERGEHVRMEQLHVPHVAVEHQDYQQPVKFTMFLILHIYILSKNFYIPLFNIRVW